MASGRPVRPRGAWRKALWAAAAGVALLGQGAARAADIVIGQVAPLSGVLASTGEQMVLGGKIYFEAVNAQGGFGTWAWDVVVGSAAGMQDAIARHASEASTEMALVA